MQSNETLSELQKKEALLKGAEATLFNLLLEMTGNGLDDIELKVSQLHSDVFVKRLSVGAGINPQFRRVPHGEIPDTPSLIQHA